MCRDRSAGDARQGARGLGGRRRARLRLRLRQAAPSRLSVGVSAGGERRDPAGCAERVMCFRKRRRLSDPASRSPPVRRHVSIGALPPSLRDGGYYHFSM